MARGLVGQGRGWLGRGAQRGGQGGLWWHVARRDILEQSRLGVVFIILKYVRNFFGPILQKYYKFSFITNLDLTFHSNSHRKIFWTDR